MLVGLSGVVAGRSRERGGAGRAGGPRCHAVCTPFVRRGLREWCMSPQEPREIVLALFIQHHRRVHAFACSLVDASTADDVTQETFLRLLTLPDLATREISSSYLIKIAHNLVKRRARRSASLDRLVEREAQRPPRRAEREETAPTRGRAAEGMRELPGHHHEAVRLIVCEGLSYQAAAESLGVTVTTVNNWKHRGLSRLREQGAEAGLPPGRSAAG